MGELLTYKIPSQRTGGASTKMRILLVLDQA
jgi:hypothetical protein